MTDQALVINTVGEVVGADTIMVDLLVMTAEENRPRRMVTNIIVAAVDVVVTADEVVVVVDEAVVVVAVDRRIRRIRVAVAASKPLRFGAMARKMRQPSPCHYQCHFVCCGKQFLLVIVKFALASFLILSTHTTTY
jgi:hypothetical protein